MIVVDTNVVAYLLIDGDQTLAAERVLNKDPYWIAPLLWRSEMRNILTLYVRRSITLPQDAKFIMSKAEMMFVDREYKVNSDKVLDLAFSSGCTAYDCEFVSIAELLDIPLVTSDKKLLAAFPNIAESMEAFVA